ncbi:hypothetical protein GOODEAATRI_007143, partial [Goodea atripinnis]
VYCIDLIQPDSKVVQPGQSLIITCQPSGYSVSDSSYATGWIRQRQGKPLEWIFHRWGGGDFYQNDALKNKFSYSRDTSAGTVIITGQNLQPEDTAVYYFVRRPTVIQTTDKSVQKPISQQETLTHKVHMKTCTKIVQTELLWSRHQFIWASHYELNFKR